MSWRIWLIGGLQLKLCLNIIIGSPELPFNVSIQFHIANFDDLISWNNFVVEDASWNWWWENMGKIKGIR